MTRTSDLRQSVEKARRRVFWTIGFAAFSAVIAGAMGEGFPNSVQSDLAEVALIVFVGIFVLFSIRLNSVVNEWKKQERLRPPNKAT
jgi:hypothetical protein